MPLSLVVGLRSLVAGLAALAFLAPSAAAAPGGEPTLPPPIPRGRALAALADKEQVLLALEPGTAAGWLVAAEGGRLVSASLGIWKVDGNAVARLVPLLSRRGDLRYAEPDRVRILNGHLEQGDPLLAKAWHIARIGADVAEPPGPGIPLTLVDTGLDMTSPDFATRPDVTLLNTQSTGSFGGPQYHGTIVASTAAAAANGVGTVGVDPYAALRVFDLPSLDDATIIKALDQVATGNPTVVNLSLGGPGYSRALYEAIMRLVNSGALVVAAAGNSATEGDPEIYPADFPHVLTVAATDEDDRPAFFSSSSSAIDLAAPGVDIPVQNPTDPEGFELVDGTSFAAPIVSAAATWIWTARPSLDPTQLFELLRASARDLGRPGFDKRTGEGLVDIPAALGAPAPSVDPAEPNDDVDLVKAGRVFSSAKPALTAPGRGTASLSARLDAVEDPHDVYRVFIPAGRTIEISIVPGADVDAALWRPQTRSVLGPKKNRLAVSAHPRLTPERLVYRNKTGKALTAFVDVWIPAENGGVEATYTLKVRTR